MGHHPPVGGQQVAEIASSGGLSPLTWILIIVGALVVIYIIYNFFKKE